MRMIRTHSGFTIIEVLVAMLIMTIAFAIVLTAPGYLVRLSEKAQIVTDIYDLALSLAERAIFEGVSSLPSSETINNVTYVVEYTSNTTSTTVLANVRISVYPLNREAEKVELLIYSP